VYHTKIVLTKPPEAKEIAMYIQFFTIILIPISNVAGFVPSLLLRSLRTNSLLFPRSMTFYSDFDDINNQSSDETHNDTDDDYTDEVTISDKNMEELRSRISLEYKKERKDNPVSDSDEDTVYNDDDYEDEEEDDTVQDLLPQLDSTTSFSSIDELISYASSKSSISADRVKAPSTDWALPIDDISSDISTKLKPGTILIANPAKFCSDFGSSERSSFFTQKRPSSALLAKFGLTAAPPPELGADRRSELLPVLILLDRQALKGCQALLLNRRTGYLMGDLDQPPQETNSSEEEYGSNYAAKPSKHRYEAFMIQPLWFGGTSPSGEAGGFGGLDMIHRCPYVHGSKKLTEDGLFWGGDPFQAQEVLVEKYADEVFTGFDFKFFVQSTRWLPTQLEKEIKDGVWFCASVSKEVLFKSRDRSGQSKSKPLWTEIMELMGGEYKEIRDQFYADETQ